MENYSSYVSPFSWRYGSNAMRQIWGEEYKRILWRKCWVALAKAQSSFGLVTKEQVIELEQNANAINVEEATKLEAEIHHDLMAELMVFASQCPTAGGVIHLGATSMDIKDNAEVLQIRESLNLILSRLNTLLECTAALVEFTAGTACISFTHLQPAEPTTYGYRFAAFAQDLLEDFVALRVIHRNLRGKGFKGAVGTASAYSELLEKIPFEDFEDKVAQYLNLSFYPVTTQTYSRKQDYDVVSHLTGIAGIAYKFALDLRILQSPVIGELREPFSEKQVGSSAMPFKKNPIEAEKIDSLARLMSASPMILWHNFAESILERTLDDSANRRTVLPESFLALDEILLTLTRIIQGININHNAISQNLEHYAPFAGVERLLMRLARYGADRQIMHETLRKHSLEAWKEVESGNQNPLVNMVCEDNTILQFMKADDIRIAFNIADYTGIAEQRAKDCAKKIREVLQTSD